MINLRLFDSSSNELWPRFVDDKITRSGSGKDEMPISSECEYRDFCCESSCDGESNDVDPVTQVTAEVRGIDPATKFPTEVMLQIFSLLDDKKLYFSQDLRNLALVSRTYHQLFSVYAAERIQKIKNGLSRFKLSHVNSFFTPSKPWVQQPMVTMMDGLLRENEKKISGLNLENFELKQGFELGSLLKEFRDCCHGDDATLPDLVGIFERILVFQKSEGGPVQEILGIIPSEEVLNLNTRDALYAQVIKSLLTEDNDLEAYDVWFQFILRDDLSLEGTYITNRLIHYYIDKGLIRCGIECYNLSQGLQGQSREARQIIFEKLLSRQTKLEDALNLFEDMDFFKEVPTRLPIVLEQFRSEVHESRFWASDVVAIIGNKSFINKSDRKEAIETIGKGLAKHGFLELALAVEKLLYKKNMKNFLYCGIIEGLIEHGHYEEGLKMIKSTKEFERSTYAYQAVEKLIKTKQVDEIKRDLILEFIDVIPFKAVRNSLIEACIIQWHKSEHLDKEGFLEELNSRIKNVSAWDVAKEAKARLSKSMRK